MSELNNDCGHTGNMGDDQGVQMNNGKENDMGSGQEQDMLVDQDEDEQNEDIEEGEFENEIEDSTEATDVGTGEDRKSEDEDGEEKPEGLIGYKYKRVLKFDSPKSSLEPLPEGWIVLTHASGLPLYLHSATRVITWSRPYYLMSGYVMKHKVPVHSIPCLYYQRNKEKFTAAEEGTEEIKADEDKGIPEIKKESNEEEKAQEERNGNIENLPNQPKVILHKKKDMCLSDDELKDYLERRFEFQTLKIPRFKKWSQRRNFKKNLLRKKQLEEADIDTGSSATKNTEDGKSNSATPAKLITLTIEQEDGPGGATRNRKFVLNTSGKPMICILHEYAQRVLRVQPKYTFNIREDSSEPFEAIIKLNDKEYGKAVAINKKTAKNKAALATLEMLIPGFKGQVESASEGPDMGYFDKVGVTDSRVYELCVHTGQLLPYQLLTECLKRNQGITDTSISFDVQQGKRKSLNYTMKCGKHVANGVAKNKKIGKQMAAQQILSFLHPKVNYWSELIELYGTSLAQERANRKHAEQEIFDLKQKRGNFDDDRPGTSKNSSTTEDQNSLEPNPELLAKLRHMMLKLEEKREKKRKVKEEDEDTPEAKRKKLSPMAAAVAAGKGLEISCPVENQETINATEM